MAVLIPPKFLGDPNKRKRGPGKHEEPVRKLIELPQTFLTWTLSNDRDEKSAKIITGIIRLTDCTAVPNDDGPQRGQIRAWQDRKKKKRTWMVDMLFGM